VAPLYGSVILDRFRHPRRRGELTAPDVAHEDVNPLCGDRIRIEARLGDGSPPVIDTARFRGDACAIAVAAADVLLEMVEGRPVRDAQGIDRETLLAALGGDIRPSRLGCVALPLGVLHRAISAATPHAPKPGGPHAPDAHAPKPPSPLRVGGAGADPNVPG
jgi:nitrogen fixation NifU-like protein